MKSMTRTSLYRALGALLAIALLACSPTAQPAAPAKPAATVAPQPTTAVPPTAVPPTVAPPTVAPTQPAAAVPTAAPKPTTPSAASAPVAPTVTPAQQQAAADFYRGKVVRIVVGYDPGGGFDQVARLIQRHLPNHIPGNPTVIVENMPGAGIRLTANHLFTIAPSDGTVFGTFNELQPLQQALGEANIEFDARRFGWIGSAAASTPVCIVRATTGVKSFQDLVARGDPLPFGGLGPGSNPSDIPVLNQLAGAKVRVANGYKGTADIARGIEGGELAGGCWPWESISSNHRNLLDSGAVNVVVQFGARPHPELADVPLASAVIADAEGRSILQTFRGPNEISKPFATSPNVPADRLVVLQKAFLDALADPALLADAGQARIDLAPKSGEQVKQVIESILTIEPEAAKKLAAMLAPQ